MYGAIITAALRETKLADAPLWSLSECQSCTNVQGNNERTHPHFTRESVIGPQSPLSSRSRESIVSLLRSFHNDQGNKERTDPYFIQESHRSPNYLLRQRKPSTQCFNPFTTVHAPDPHCTRESSVPIIFSNKGSHRPYASILSRPSKATTDPVLQSFHTRPRQQRKDRSVLCESEASVPTLSCSPSKEAIDPVLQSFHNRSRQRNTRSTLYERVIGPSREAIVPVLQSFHNRPRQQRKDRPALHERVIGRSIISSIKGSHRPSASMLSQPFKATKGQIRNLHFTRESSILIIFTIKGSHRPSVL
jgi:hypothetical protein